MSARPKALRDPWPEGVPDPWPGGVPDPWARGLPDKLDELARRVGRLAPCRRDPERFHVEKSEIAHELRRLAQHAGGR